MPTLAELEERRKRIQESDLPERFKAILLSYTDDQLTGFTDDLIEWTNRGETCESDDKE